MLGNFDLSLNDRDINDRLLSFPSNKKCVTISNSMWFISLDLFPNFSWFYYFILSKFPINKGLSSISLSRMKEYLKIAEARKIATVRDSTPFLFTQLRFTFFFCFSFHFKNKRKVVYSSRFFFFFFFFFSFFFFFASIITHKKFKK